MQSCPLCLGRPRTTNATLDRNTLNIIEGISSALLTLIDHFCEKDGADTLFDESTLHTLHMFSFCMTHTRSRCIRMFGIQIFLQHVASMLQIDIRELILAYIIVERLVREDGRLLQNNTVRLVFLTAVSLVMKLVIDCEWFTTNTFVSIQDFVIGIDCDELAEMEWRVLTILDYSLPIAADRIRDSFIIYTVKLMEEAGVVMNEEEAEQVIRDS